MVLAGGDGTYLPEVLGFYQRSGKGKGIALDIGIGISKGMALALGMGRGFCMASRGGD